ncbi:MAG TPA: hypothetical protein VKU41_07635 [Polyangiaceae bacterium]|nr:hypothetical protein [Polyangiaceae bacterium]
MALALSSASSLRAQTSGDAPPAGSAIAATPSAPASAPSSGESPKRAVPDYDGRGPPPDEPGAAALWVPRVVLSPAYLATEYVLRRPLSLAIPAAEHADLPRKVYDLFTFGPEHKAGFAPIGFVEFDFNPSVGVYAFWDDAGFSGNDLRLHAEAWPTDWVAGSLTERIAVTADQSVQLRVSAVHRPDRVFYGLGPRSLQADQSRYADQRVDLSASHEWRFWRSSTIETRAGLRDVDTSDGHFGGDPSLSREARTGAFEIPDGFGREYTDEYNRLVLALDSRARQERPGSGVRVELGAEQGNNLHGTPASGFLRYGATAAGYLDLNGRSRVLGLSITTLFADPLGSRLIPFTELVSLGGDKLMLAYFGGRLIDRSAAVATLSYAWPVGPWLDGHLEIAAGNVFGMRLAGFDWSLLRLSGAVGVSIGGLRDAPIEALIGLGTETFAQSGQVDSVRVMLGVPHSF